MNARHFVALLARFAALTLVATSLVSTVGCGKLANPVGLDKNLDQQIQTAPIDRSVQTADARRAPFEPVDPPAAPVASAITVSVDGQSSFAYHVHWNAIGGALAYQLFMYSDDKGAWTMLTQTQLTEVSVPRMLAPHSLTVRVRAILGTFPNLQYGDFSNTTTAQLAGGNSGGPSGGGGGGPLRTTLE